MSTLKQGNCHFFANKIAKFITLMSLPFPDAGAAVQFIEPKLRNREDLYCTSADAHAHATLCNLLFYV